MPSHSRHNRLILGIAGRIGSGKTSIGEYLAATHDFQYLRYSQILSDWLAKDPARKSHLQEIGWQVMAGGMQVELSQRLIGNIAPAGNVAVDGLRHPLDFQSLSSRFSSSFRLLFVASPLEIRSQRLQQLGKYRDNTSFEMADAHPVEQQIETLREKATVLVRNEGSLTDLYAKVNQVIQDIAKEGGI